MGDAKISRYLVAQLSRGSLAAQRVRETHEICPSVAHLLLLLHGGTAAAVGLLRCVRILVPRDPAPDRRHHVVFCLVAVLDDAICRISRGSVSDLLEFRHSGRHHAGAFDVGQTVPQGGHADGDTLPAQLLLLAEVVALDALQLQRRPCLPRQRHVAIRGPVEVRGGPGLRHGGRAGERATGRSFCPDFLQWWATGISRPRSAVTPLAKLEGGPCGRRSTT